MATIDDYEEVLSLWERKTLVGPLEEFKLEVDESIPKDHIALALYLDYSSSKTSGEANDALDGYTKLALELLHFLKITMHQDNKTKTIIIKASTEYHDTQDKLKEFMWG